MKVLCVEKSRPFQGLGQTIDKPFGSRNVAEAFVARERRPRVDEDEGGGGGVEYNVEANVHWQTWLSHPDISGRTRTGAL